MFIYLCSLFAAYLKKMFEMDLLFSCLCSSSHELLLSCRGKSKEKAAVTTPRSVNVRFLILHLFLIRYILSCWFVCENQGLCIQILILSGWQWQMKYMKSRWWNKTKESLGLYVCQCRCSRWYLDWGTVHTVYHSVRWRTAMIMQKTQTNT